MMNIVPLNTLLLQADAFDVAQKLKALASEPAARRDALQFLKEQRPAEVPLILGLVYDVAVYPTDALTEDVPPEEVGKFFVSTLVEDFDNAPRLDLGDTAEQAWHIAVTGLQLDKLYEAECAAARDLPRMVL
jgi:hypothetical protein